MVASGLILAAAVLVASPAPEAQPETVPNRYIVEFVDPPAAAFNGLADKRGDWVLEPTNPAVLDPEFRPAQPTWHGPPNHRAGSL